jgi:hypothetical protein
MMLALITPPAAAPAKPPGAQPKKPKRHIVRNALIVWFGITALVEAVKPHHDKPMSAKAETAAETAVEAPKCWSTKSPPLTLCAGATAAEAHEALLQCIAARRHGLEQYEGVSMTISFDLADRDCTRAYGSIAWRMSGKPNY